MSSGMRATSCAFAAQVSRSGSGSTLPSLPPSPGPTSMSLPKPPLALLVPEVPPFALPPLAPDGSSGLATFGEPEPHAQSKPSVLKSAAIPVPCLVIISSSAGATIDLAAATVIDLAAVAAAGILRATAPAALLTAAARFVGGQAVVTTRAIQLAPATVRKFAALIGK